MALHSGSSGLLAGAGQRVALALVPVALLWAAVLWATIGGREAGTRASAPPPAPPVLQAVVASGEASPADGTFDRFDVEGRAVAAPANRHGDVAFFATLLHSRAEEGLFLAAGGRIVKLAAVGDAVPSGERIASFGENPALSINESAAVVFAAGLTGGKATSGVFMAQNGRLTAVALSGAAAPEITGGTLADFEPAAINDAGDVAFLASVRHGRESGEAIYLWHRGELAKIAGTGDAVPGGGLFSGFGNPALNKQGEVAFGAVVEQGPILGGIFASSGKVARLVLAAGSPSPTGGIFARFSERIELNAAGAVALSAVLRQGGPESAVFLIDGDVPRSMAAVGEPAPGGGSFAGFASWPGLSEAGAVGFIASVDGGPNGLALYLAGAGGAMRIAALGDALPGGGRLVAFPLFPALTVGPDGAVTFAATSERDSQRSDTLFYYGPLRAKR